MNRRQSLDVQRKPVVDRILESLGVATLSLIAVLFLLWVAGGFR